MLREADFEQEIAACPDDIGARLIYADWLEERGDPRGEFIRVQCAIAALGADDPRRDDLLDRSAQLLRRHHRKWVAPLLSDGIAQLRFSSGFVEEAQFATQRFLERGEQMFAHVPVLRALHFSKMNGSTCAAALQLLSRLPAAARLQNLDLAQRAVGQRELAILAASPLSRLAVLNLSWNDWINDEGLQLLAQSPITQSLEVLDLRGAFFGVEGAYALAESDGLQRLRLLVISSGVALSPGRDGRRILRLRFREQLMEC